MRKKRFIAWCLAVAMTVSSLPMGLGMETKTAQAAETTTDTSADKLLEWSESSAYQYSEDGVCAAYVREFQSPTLDGFYLYRPSLGLDEEKISELVETLKSENSLSED